MFWTDKVIFSVLVSDWTVGKDSEKVWELYSSKPVLGCDGILSSLLSIIPPSGDNGDDAYDGDVVLFFTEAGSGDDDDDDDGIDGSPLAVVMEIIDDGGEHTLSTVATDDATLTVSADTEKHRNYQIIFTDQK